MTDVVMLALSVYGTTYNPDYADQCDVEIPPMANWCGVFAGWLLTENGCDLPPRPQVARSYLKVGVPVDKPAIGDIIVFWRVAPRDWRGHVSIFIRDDDKGIYCLGGNQKGKVQIIKYDRKKLLGFRRL